MQWITVVSNFISIFSKSFSQIRMKTKHENNLLLTNLFPFMSGEQFWCNFLTKAARKAQMHI